MTSPVEVLAEVTEVEMREKGNGQFRDPDSLKLVNPKRCTNV